MRQFNPSTDKIEKAVQMKCFDTIFETGGIMEISQDNSVGVVLTREQSTAPRWCAVVFDPVTYTVLRKIPLWSEPERADAVVISPDNKTAYILSDFITNTQKFSNVYPLDLTTQTLGQAIAVNEPRIQWTVMSPEGSTLFMRANTFPYHLWTLDTNTQVPTELVQTELLISSPRWMVMHPFGHKLYIVYDGPSGTVPMQVIDTATGTLLSTTRPFTDELDNGVKLARRSDPQFTPDGRYMFVMGGATNITVIDTNDDSVAGRILAFSGPVLSNDLAMGFFYIPLQ
ncbi:MAG: hypothetical protein ABI995_03120 [Acidobacteriota bacterium]